MSDTNKIIKRFAKKVDSLNWQSDSYQTRAFEKVEAEIDALVAARVAEGRVAEWKDLLGADYKKFFPVDNYHDFVSVPSDWINKRLLALTQGEPHE